VSKYARLVVPPRSGCRLGDPVEVILDALAWPVFFVIPRDVNDVEERCNRGSSACTKLLDGFKFAALGLQDRDIVSGFGHLFPYEVLPNFAVADELAENLVVFGVSADSSGDDCWMNPQLFSQRLDRRGASSSICVAPAPDLAWERGVACKAIRFEFRIRVGIKLEVIEKGLTGRLQVTQYMYRLVENSEPEVVQAVVADRQCNDGCTGLGQQGRSVKKRSW
jgi:hypothetical protein